MPLRASVDADDNVSAGQTDVSKMSFPTENQAAAVAVTDEDCGKT